MQHLCAAQTILDRAQSTMGEVMETMARLSRDIHDAETRIRLALALHKEQSGEIEAAVPTEAMVLAQKVSERGLSKQSVEILTQIYEAASQPHMTANGIATAMGLAHSTVDRAIKAAALVTGPHPVTK
ncbi:hypothetical protein ACQP0C_41590 (plasmid) [Nocardia sp. CA-129566]|uniref:hypothetical protein n=1 Tax=Nocardia sp. CA-129566 TaxID=3239976 RepID=UPI003D9A0806